MTRASDVPAKKPYLPPKLTVYGDLTHLTMAKVVGSMMADNMMLTRKT
jgi:hypothetical protein